MIRVRTLVKSAYQKDYFSYFSTKTYVVGSQKNRLNEYPKHMLKLMGKKIFTILRSKILLSKPVVRVIQTLT